MNKFILLVFLFITINQIASSQIYVDNAGNVYDQRKTHKKRQPTKQQLKTLPSKPAFDKSKIVFGGNFGLQFGDYTVVNVSPQVGYRFSEYFTFGAGFGYSYHKNKFYGGDSKSHYASFNLFGRVYPIKYIVFALQPEINRMWRSVDSSSGKNTYTENKFVPTVLVGGGFRFMGLTAMLQYDLVQDKNSPYGNQVFYSIGYGFNF